MEKAIRLLDSIAPLESDLRDYLHTALDPIEYDNDAIVVREGAIARSLGFIETGLVRGYRINYKGNEFTSWFMKEGDIYASVRSFFSQRPATEMVQCLEPTLIYSLSFERLKFILKNWPSFHYHRAELLQKYYLQADEREEMRQDRAYNRFCFLMKHFPDLESRVPDKYLASYLSLTPTYYSTVKSQYFKNHPRNGNQ
jgi:CRP-like cAMP-binding protein